MAESSYEIIKSNFEQSGESDGSTDESVSTSELPDLVPIEPKEEKKETESSPDPEDEIVDDSDTQWVDLLGSGRLYKKITNKGTGEKAERGKLARLQIRVPKEPTSLSFGTEACELNDHNIVEVLLGDGLDCPPAVELATYELNVGGEVAIRSHPDLRANLPEAFAIKLLEILPRNLLKLADKSKEEGNSFWKLSDFKKAILFYQRGIRLIDENSSENEPSEVSKDLWIKIMKNIGRCQFKLQENAKSIEKFNEILAIDSENFSVLDLKGDVLLKDKNYTELHKLCDKALKIKGLTTAQKEKMTKRIETCKKENIKQAEKHKAMCARMFKPLNTPPKGETETSKSEESSFEDEIPAPMISPNVLIGAIIVGVLAIGAWQAKKYINV